MSDKARLFRSLLLEPLECRSVFSVDGLDVWQSSHQPSDFEFNRFEPAQYPQSESERLPIGLRSIFLQSFSLQSFSLQKSFSLQSRILNRLDDIQSESNSNQHSRHGALHHEHGRFNDDSNLLPLIGEGEGQVNIGHPYGSESKQTQAPQQSRETKVVDLVKTLPTIEILPQLRDFTQANFSNSQTDSSSVNRASSHRAGFAIGNSSLERAPNSVSQNTPASTSIASPTYAATQANLVSLNSSALSAMASGTAFDFSSRPANISERPSATVVGGQREDGFRFTMPQPTPSDSIFDQSLIERAAGVESLENLLSGLAENHRRGRIQDGFDADQPDTGGEQNWRPEGAVSVDIAFADGGMIALALNRDVALGELEDITDDARSENKAWIANVGIYRAFENGAVAATEYSGLTNRVSRNEESTSTSEELIEVEGEVAKSQLHPLLASTSAAIGAVMFGLRRRMRKSSPLLFTSRKR